MFPSSVHSNMTFAFWSPDSPTWSKMRMTSCQHLIPLSILLREVDYGSISRVLCHWNLDTLSSSSFVFESRHLSVSLRSLQNYQGSANTAIFWAKCHNINATSCLQYHLTCWTRIRWDIQSIPKCYVGSVDAYKMAEKNLFFFHLLLSRRLRIRIGYAQICHFEELFLKKEFEKWEKVDINSSGYKP